MWIEKCPHCQESVIIHTEGMKFTIFFVFWLLVNFIDVSIFSADVDKDVYIYHILQLQIVNQVFSSDL